MRAGLSTIQQTLTPEAASVLNKSIAEAARRSHSQTTPLHVAATLLASPTGLFRQACIRSHPNSPHPLQCRALELCFSVALDRLPSNSNPSACSANNHSGGGSSNASDGTAGSPALVLEKPPISNALMAALKRAQAHQRRGCPEQQQQPLLAVKVELEQLIVSILDDPSVSRVMREASFSSPAVKATIQQSLIASTSSSVATTVFSSSPSASTDSRLLGSAAAGGQLGGLRPSLTAPGAPLLPGNRNLYLNPRLLQLQQQQQGSGGGGGDGLEHHDEVKRVIDILLRTKKRNPVLVSDSLPEVLLKEVLQRIERREVGEGPLRNVEVISLEKQLTSDRSQIPLKLQELGNSIDVRFGNAGTGGVILDLGDLKWLVESPGGGVAASSAPVPIHQQQKAVLEIGRTAVAEMAKLLGRFAEGAGAGRIWLIGTATCATYLRCQVYHPTMEVDWDLQAVPIAPGAPQPGVFPRIAGKGILSSSVESLSFQKGFPPIGAPTIAARRPLEYMEPSSRGAMCPACTENYERELAKLVANECEKSSAESKPEPRKTLPPWLQVANHGNVNAKPPASQIQTKEQELKWKQKTEELLMRWTETCSRLHPRVNHAAGGGTDKPVAPPLPMSNLYNPNLFARQSFQTKLQPPRSCSPLQLSNQSNPVANTPARPASPPGSPVRTDLVLGRAKPTSESAPEKSHRERLNDSPGCTQDRFSRGEKVSGGVDLDSFKRLFKGLTEKVTWQPEAASLVAATVIQCKSGDTKRRGAGARGDAWLLFMGPDKVGKRQMAMALSELVVGSGPVTVNFVDSKADGDHLGPHASFRGNTALDRVVEAVRRDPFSVVVLENVEHADMLAQANLRRAIERGRLPDSHGREVSLGSVIFIMISDAWPENLKTSMASLAQCEEKLSAAARSGWQLELAVGKKPGKRQAEWSCEEDNRVARPRKETAGPPGLSLDLNLAAARDENGTECSPNSSDLTVEHEHSACGRLAVLNRPPPPAIPDLLTRAVDEAVMFKPVDFGELRRKVSDTITRKFRSVVCDDRSLCIDDEALDRVVGGVWFGTTPAAGFEEWAERVLVPGFQQLRSSGADGGTVVRLLPVKDGCAPHVAAAEAAAATAGEWLPSKMTVAVDGPCGT